MGASSTSVRQLGNPEANLIIRDSAADSSIQNAKGSSGEIHRLIIDNRDGLQTVYLLMWSKATTPEFGTDPADYILSAVTGQLRRLDLRDLANDGGLSFADGLYFAVSTAKDVATNPTVAPVIELSLS